MLQPEEQLKNISFDEEVNDVLKTTNKVKWRMGQFEGWEDTREHPFESPQRKPRLNPVKKPNYYKLTVSKPSPSQPTSKPLNIQNKQNFSISPNQLQKTMRIMQLLDQQLLSPKSRKIIIPHDYSQQKNSQKLFSTPRSSHRTRDISLRKICNTERLRKTQRQTLNTTQQSIINNKRQIQLEDNLRFNDYNLLTCRNGEVKQDSFKVPLSAIQYPVLRLNAKRPVRRMERFQSFVARNVRK